MKYAGFWMRFLAHLLDGVILSAAGMIVVIPALGGAAILAAIEEVRESPEAIVALIVSGIGIVGLAALGVVFYNAWFESSKWQATPGKMALGLYVAGEDGGRITLARASGRYFAKALSGIVLNIGYIMAAFTERKQALHDILASTVVLQR
jgi:uncharacterized RDD family membrane protein YckC